MPIAIVLKYTFVRTLDQHIMHYVNQLSLCAFDS